jgi:hypothetical protein
MPREYYTSLQQAWIDLMEKGLLILTIGCGVILTVWLMVICVTMLHRRHMRKLAEAPRASRPRPATILGAYRPLSPSHQALFSELFPGSEELDFAQWNEQAVNEAASYGSNPAGGNF